LKSLEQAVKRDVIIIGAGAAGLMCAAEAGRRGRSVLVLDHAKKIGSKILASGGGRSNFTNVTVTPDHYKSGNPHFCKSAIARYSPHDFMAMLERHGIAFHEEAMGRLFCDRGSSDVVRMLRDECAAAGVEVRLHCPISAAGKDDLFTVSTHQGTFRSESLVVATGGLSFPELGASGFGHRLAEQFGMTVTPLEPALVPLTFGPEDKGRFRELSGISIDAVVTCKGRTFRENILFTHRGLSGPAILQVSLYREKSDTINIDLLPGIHALEIFMTKRESKTELVNLLSGFFPKRFARAWCDLSFESKPMHQYSLKELKDIASRLHSWEVRPAGTEGFHKAEVTRGGVDTDELSSKTMEAKKVPGLFFVGEVVDVTGQLGGYNLHWAWASGFVAGQYV
jgi:hypothetical protein